MLRGQVILVDDQPETDQMKFVTGDGVTTVGYISKDDLEYSEEEEE